MSDSRAEGYVPRRSVRPGPLALVVAVIATAVFWRTSYPTITWWDSSSYSLAAATLGVASPPGSLLLTLLGWPIARVASGATTAHALNLFAGALAGITVGLVYMIAMRLTRNGGAVTRRERATAIGAGLGALTFAFSDTLWEHAIRFTPYILTAVFTGLILWTMLRWWEDAASISAWRWLALLGLLFGLDFSVHRTNALLLPGALVWILLRHPATLRRPRALIGGACGLMAGLLVQLLILPIGAFTRSQLNFNEPNTLAKWWDYVSLKQLGGGFLLNLSPRKSDFWTVQVADVWHVVGANFLHWSGPTRVLGVLPALAALFGLAALWRSNKRLGLAFALVLFLQASMTVAYFNIPAGFFRPFDRHYLPVCVTIAILASYGLGALMQGEMRTRATAIATAAIVLLAPASQLLDNWSAHDASGRYFTRDYAVNALQGLPPNAIYFTVGDNDTFPVMYVQSVEGVRRDVTIINLSVANLPGYPDQLRRRDPSFPITVTGEQRRALADRAWTDTAVVVPVAGTAEPLGLPAGTAVPPSISLDVRPTNGARMLPASITLLDIVRTNHWRRPLSFASTATRSGMEWLAPYGRLDGLYWRVLPVRDAPPDVAKLDANMLERSEYRGYADPAVRIDDVARMIGFQYYEGFKALLAGERAAGAIERCQLVMRTLLTTLPPERLTLPDDYREAVALACGPTK